MRQKYVEERFSRYFVFGRSPDGKTVDLSDNDRACLATLEPEQAADLIRDREKAVDMIVELALKLDEVAPEEFTKLWYGGQM